MTQYFHDTADNLALDETAYERRDLYRRDIVDQAIAVQESRNTMSAVEFLKAHDVAAPVIERVLLDPEHRRSIS
jgi:hypothetical protein